MVEVCCPRILQLSCSSWELGQPTEFSVTGDSSLDARASPPQPEALSHLASPRCPCGPLAPTPCHSSPLSQPALRRQTSSVRAVCVNALVRIRAGGRQATVVPTATVEIWRVHFNELTGFSTECS